MKERDFFAHHNPTDLQIIRKAVIGIAGAGGLGSNIAVSLTRAGIGKLVIADYDYIEISNLNRQQYFSDQIGLPKVDALKENLNRISSFTEYETHQVKLDKNNIPVIFKNVDMMIEAFDLAEMKEMLIESWITTFPEKPLIIASGLAGFGKNELTANPELIIFMFVVMKFRAEKGHLPYGSQSGIVANMQANLALELLINGSPDE